MLNILWGFIESIDHITYDYYMHLNWLQIQIYFKCMKLIKLILIESIANEMEQNL